MSNKEIIEKNFSKYAPYYDRYSTIQDLCAQQLASKINGRTFSRVLDIGCGTGNYTLALKEKLPNAKIKALDISGKMIDIAKKKLKDKDVEFIVGDGERIDIDESFDLVSSNATFQWFDNLKTSLTQYKIMLEKEGMILFSIFGPKTFCELDQALKRYFGQDKAIPSYNFTGKEGIEEILTKLFKKVSVEDIRYRERYDSLRGLLRAIKYTGTRGPGMNNGKFWTTKVINDLEKIYREDSPDLSATYQVFLCKGTA